jgi:hypothetical protein
MTEASRATSAPYAQPSGRVFRWAFAYDLPLNIIWRGSGTAALVAEPATALAVLARMRFPAWRRLRG